MLAGDGAGAQSRGDTTLMGGLAHMEVRSPGTSVVTQVRPNPLTLAGAFPESFGSPEVRLTPRHVNTFGLAITHFLSDHLALELDLGYPPRVPVDGHGSADAPGAVGEQLGIDLDDPALQPLGSQRQWSPALLVQYRFRAPDAVLRPYLGLGATYTWFTHTRINAEFARRLDQRYGQPLALASLKPGPTSVAAETRPVFEPVLNAGLSLAARSRWMVTLTAAYIPFSTRTLLTVTAADGTRLSRSEIRLEGEALLAAVLLGRRF